MRIAGCLHVPPLAKVRSGVIICHGFLGTKEGGGRAVEFAQELAEEGYAVLRFDFSGTGESEGSFAQATLSGYGRDLAAAVHFMAERGITRIAVIGRSFGGVVAICQGAVEQRIGGVCTWGTPWDIEGVLRRSLGDEAFSRLARGETVTWRNEFGEYCKHPVFLEDLRAFNVLERVRHISPRPLLVIHGEQDEIVPHQEAEVIYARANEPKQVVVVRGAGHQFLEHQKEVREITLGWLKEWF